MLFNSIEYALFLIAVLGAYFRLPVQPRWPVPLVASYVFYMGWRPLFALLLAFSSLQLALRECLASNPMTNFRRPYFSRSLTEFWRRWHISLSSWFFDYVYFPIGGIHQSLGLSIRNIMVVFLLCGLWHGAAWKFVIWGAWNGVILCAERTGTILLTGTSAWRRFKESKGGIFLLGAAGLLWTRVTTQ